MLSPTPAAVLAERRRLILSGDIDGFADRVATLSYLAGRDLQG
jgi:hypothetical protein